MTSSGVRLCGVVPTNEATSAALLGDRCTSSTPPVFCAALRDEEQQGDSTPRWQP
jgi:hypothetical protein